MQRYIVMRVLLGLFLLFTVVFFIVRLASGSEESATSDKPTFVTEENDNVEGNTPVDESPTPTEQPLTAVEMRVVGKIVAQEDHRELRFIITENRRTVQLIQGYSGKVMKTMTLPNSEDSFNAFVAAIEAQGFSEAKPEPKITNPDGICSSAKQFHFLKLSNGTALSNLWGTSCRSSQGTFGGDRSDVRELFEDQFPEYSEFVDDVRF